MWRKEEPIGAAQSGQQEPGQPCAVGRLFGFIFLSVVPCALKAFMSSGYPAKAMGLGWVAIETSKQAYDEVFTILPLRPIGGVLEV